MKKTRFLVLVLAVAVMLVGAAYAYWSQDLAINTTVKTGELEVIFQEPADIVGEDDYQINADCTPGGYVMTVTFNDVYPGVRNNFYFDMVNMGTLKAYVDDFNIPGTSGVLNEILVHSIKIDGNEISISDAPVKLRDALVYLNNGNGIGIEPLAHGSTDEEKKSTENRDNKVKVEMDLEFDKNATEADMAELATYGFQITSQVYQFNEKE